MLRHMVQLQVGKKLSDTEYSAAMKIAIRTNGLKEHNGAVDLRGRSAGSISAIAGQITEAFRQPESDMESAERDAPA